eukprot:gene19640-26326_t
MAASVQYYTYSLTYQGVDENLTASFPGKVAMKFTSSEESGRLPDVDSVRALVVKGQDDIVKVVQMQKQPDLNVYIIYVESQSQPALAMNQVVGMTFIVVRDGSFEFDVLDGNAEQDVKKIKVMLKAGRSNDKLWYGLSSDMPTSIVPAPAPLAQVVASTASNKSLIQFDLPISTRTNATLNFAIFYSTKNINTDLRTTSVRNGLHDDIQNYLKNDIMKLTGPFDRDRVVNDANTLAKKVFDNTLVRSQYIGEDFPTDRDATNQGQMWLCMFIQKMIYELKTQDLTEDAEDMFEQRGAGNGESVFEQNTVMLNYGILAQAENVSRDFNVFAQNTALSQEAVSRVQQQRDTIENKIVYASTRLDDTIDDIREERRHIVMFSIVLVIIIGIVCAFQVFYRYIVMALTTDANSTLNGTVHPGYIIAFGLVALGVGVGVVIVNKKS